jgi:hypothetical protein
MKKMEKIVLQIKKMRKHKEYTILQNQNKKYARYNLH